MFAPCSFRFPEDARLDPVTHAFSSIVLARAAEKRLPRSGMAMMVASGVAADLDSLAYFAGPGAYLRFHQTLLHCLASSVILACVLATAFVALDRNRIRTAAVQTPVPLKFSTALAVCSAGVIFHLLLDAVSGIGLQLMWPFKIHWTALNWLPQFEIWIVLLLVISLAIPELIAMVSEEIGDHRESARNAVCAIVGLALLFVYIGVRAGLHHRATSLLANFDYQGHTPLAVGAFPSSSPLTWRAIVSTDNTLEELELSFMPGENFDPDRGVIHNKPDDSPALEAAENTAAAKSFISYARFPLASITPTDTGAQVRLRDLRFPANEKSPDNLAVAIDASTSGEPLSQTIYYEYRGFAEP
jgi:hypothetical protein